MEFFQIYGAILIPIALLNTVITLAPVLMHNVKRTVKSNKNYFNKNNYYYFVKKCVTGMYLLIPMISLEISGCYLP